MRQVKIRDITVEHDEHSIHIYRDGAVDEKLVQLITAILSREPVVEMPPPEILAQNMHNVLESFATGRIIIVPGKLIVTGDIVPVLCHLHNVDENGVAELEPFGNLCPLTEATMFYVDPADNSDPLTRKTKLN